MTSVLNEELSTKDLYSFFDRFWVCSKKQFFIEMSSIDVEIVSSGYATDAGGIVDCLVSENGHVTHRSCLDSDIEVEDLRIIPQVSDAVKEGYDRIIVLSDDTDVVILLRYYFEKFSDAGFYTLENLKVLQATINVKVIIWTFTKKSLLH